MNLKRPRTFAIVGLFLFFAFVRFSGLSDRPFHNDEGVNGFFTQNLIKSNSYKYDPLNYHGPTLYYFQLIPSWLAGFFQDPGHFHFTDANGLSVASTRATMVFVSLLVLGALLLCAPIIGEWGALTAFALAGSSATFLFYSRYFIHEIYVVLFTLGIFMSVWFLKKTKDAAYFYSAVLSSTLLICTKETGVLHVGVFGGAYIATIMAGELLDGKGVAAAFRRLAGTFKSDFALVRSGPVWTAVILCVATWFVFFSSFFHHFSGLKDFFVAYIPWIKQGLASGHVKPAKYFFTSILVPYEKWLLAMAVFGLGAAFIKNERAGLFLSFWTLGMLAVYSAIPYKTPWLAANFIVPLALLAGHGLQTVVDWINSAQDAVLRKRAMAAFVLVFGAVIAVQWPLARDLNFREWDNAKHPQVYVHTTRSMYTMLQKIDDVAKKTGDPKIAINVFSKEYWPLPFYLKENPNALFWGKLPVLDKYDAPLIVISVDQHMALRAKVKDSYSVFNYALREGYYMELWVNNDRLAPFEPQLNVPDLLVSANPRAALRSGLFQEINSGFLFEGKSISKKTVQDGVRFFFEKEEQKPTFSPFSVRWTGFVRVPAAGIYEFFLESDDGSTLALDGLNVIDNGGVHALRRKSRKVNLSAGLHAIKAEYGDAGGLAEITLSWARPGEKPVPVPASVFFCVP